jgi:adenosylmethionine-8-amino-7-oxononanoate aminotransferase
VGDVRGRGLLAGIELVEDPESRRPFDRSLRIAESVTEAAQDAGLVVWPSSGQADGTNGDLVLVAPPFIISEEEISELVHLLRIALDTAIESANAQNGR